MHKSVEWPQRVTREYSFVSICKNQGWCDTCINLSSVERDSEMKISCHMRSDVVPFHRRWTSPVSWFLIRQNVIHSSGLWLFCTKLKNAFAVIYEIMELKLSQILSKFTDLKVFNYWSTLPVGFVFLRTLWGERASSSKGCFPVLNARYAVVMSVNN